MTQELTVLTVTAASLGFLHVLLGPDHYLPFIALSRSRKWSLARTGWVTGLCGIGHILGSVLLGVLGVALGIAVTRLEIVESFRAELAAWGIIVFGLVYFSWGLRKALKRRVELRGVEKESGSSLAASALFIIFVLGPCEPLIPLLIYPAAKGGAFALLWVTAVFGAVTILTMLGVVLVS